MMNDKNILELISSTKRRDEGFVELMRRFREPLYWHIRRLVVSHEESEDILQETFIAVHRHIAKFRGNSSLKTWIYKIATNEAMHHFRREKIATSSYDDNMKLLDKFHSDSGIDFDTTEAKLQEAILTLPPKQQVIFNLRYFDELDYQQIAEIADSNVAAVKTNYHYAKKSVTEIILKTMED